VNNEVTEVSNKTLLQELQEARETISRLTAHNARSMGWDSRLTAALRERDDMQQERDSESHRARLAESRFAALKDKSAKLQSEVRRLQEALEEKRQHRLESSETILTEARSRLESVRKNTLGTSARAEQEELTRVLESLVDDNETLQRDNGELQRLLSETREDVHTLQQDLEEQRANAYPYPRSGREWLNRMLRAFADGLLSVNTPHPTFQFRKCHIVV
jgi:DNA repair exonuclease SbcCD ATPase subunit